MKQTDIICIGVAILESIIRGFDPNPVSAAGYCAESGSLSAGGDSVNASIASAKLGMRTAVLCPLGQDAAGDIILSELRRNKVITDLIQRSEEHPTPVTTIFVQDDGNRRSITNAAHRYNFHPERFMDLLPETGAVILGSLFRSPFDDPDVIRQVASAAKLKGALVLADTKLPNFRRLSLDDLTEVLPLIDYITPNEDEGSYYTGEKDPERMADVFLEKGAKNVIIKLGGKGCFFKNRGTALFLPAYHIDAVDATGAGDNFLAGFASELLRGNSVPEALQFACACGAICCTAVGSGTALKDREQVLRFLENYK